MYEIRFLSLVTICLLITTSCSLPSPDSPQFALQRLSKANATGQLVPCDVHYDINVTSEQKCRHLCAGDKGCVYFMYKEQQQCDTIEGCYLCLTRSNVNFTSPGTAKSIINLHDFVQVKMGICEYFGLCPTVQDCSELKSLGYHVSGLYPITSGSTGKLQVYCDMYTDGGGWTRRMDGSEDFFRTWSDYEVGFGNLSREFWLGNDKLSSLTSQGQYSLRVDLGDFEGTNVYAQYEQFRVDAGNDYMMYHATYSGNAGNSLLLHGRAPMKFTARDKDLDIQGSYNCAINFKGAWWYSDCHEANLNGQYLKGQHQSFADGVNWVKFRGYQYSLKFTEMKIRPTEFKPPVVLYPYIFGSTAPRDCSDYRDMGFSQNGVYPVTITDQTFDVYCDMETSGGGWMVFQRRKDGSTNFTRNNVSYENGFGDPKEEFWLGNARLAALTEQASYELRVDLEDFKGNKTFANYNTFSINRKDKYRLWLGNYVGNAGDSLGYHNQQKWSTFDDDNDSIGTSNCALNNKGGWWFNKCTSSNLNGLYLKGAYGGGPVGRGVFWKSFTGHGYSLKFTEMKIRRAGYKVHT